MQKIAALNAELQALDSGTAATTTVRGGPRAHAHEPDELSSLVSQTGPAHGRPARARACWLSYQDVSQERAVLEYLGHKFRSSTYNTPMECYVCHDMLRTNASGMTEGVSCHGTAYQHGEASPRAQRRRTDASCASAGGTPHLAPSVPLRLPQDMPQRRCGPLCDRA